MPSPDLKNSLHPSEEGPRFIGGKPYYWVRTNGVLSLKAWPNTEDGTPVPYDALER